MPNTNQRPALTFITSEHKPVSVVRRYPPSQKTLNRAEGLATIGFGNGRGHASLSGYVLINFLAYLRHQAHRQRGSLSGLKRIYNPSHAPSPSESSRAPSATKTSLQGSGFIERHEEQKGVSNHLHWPGGASGVTLGPGYDMRDRSRAEIEQKLRDIGVDSSVVSRVAAGAGLRGEAAKRFAKDNRNLVDLTDGQQRRLLQVNLPSYEAIVRRGTHVYLTQNEFDALVSYAYNPV